MARRTFAELFGGSGSSPNFLRLQESLAILASGLNPDGTSHVLRPDYENEYNVSPAGTAKGSLSAFGATIAILRGISTKDIYFGKTEAEVTTPANGGADMRKFAAAGERIQIPWGSAAFWCVNAVGGETPTVRIEGWV